MLLHLRLQKEWLSVALPRLVVATARVDESRDFAAWFGFDLVRFLVPIGAQHAKRCHF